MTVPTCRAQGCDNVADVADLCAGHRRAMTFSTRLQDAVHEFLHKPQGGSLQSSVVVTTKNRDNIELAGTYLAQGMALLISACFGTGIDYKPDPISLRTSSKTRHMDWRTEFEWLATDSTPIITDELDDFDDDEDYEDDP